MSTVVANSPEADFCAANNQPLRKWSEQKANHWYRQQPWLVGSNYIPATAINQLEMWQADTFDPQRINLELGWAEGLGINVMRVFLHDLLWEEDRTGFSDRLNTFLAIASKHRIRTMLVLFDSCWNPFPQIGIQPPPTPGIHNSGWVQSPGARALSDSSQYQRLENYVRGVVSTFANDSRVLAWDVWNEPDNENIGSYPHIELGGKLRFVDLLLPQVFQWARVANPSQPLTSGVWAGDWSSPAELTSIQRTQLEESDVISFHTYESPEEFEKRATWLRRYGRPLLCTEFMARCTGSTFEGILPLAKAHKVAAMNWGFVAGKTQTFLPWSSWQSPHVSDETNLWFHEVLHTDGTPYCDSEVKAIGELTGAKLKTFAATTGG